MAAEVDRTLAALADPTRRAIVDLLHERAQRPSEVAEALGVSRPALSRHLRVLRRAGLIADEFVEGDARARVMRLQRQPFRELRGWLDEVEGFWGDQLDSFKHHAERVHRRRRR